MNSEERSARLIDGSESSLRRFLQTLSPVDQIGAQERAAMLGTRSIKTSSKKWAIDMAISMVDLTTLEGADTPGKVRALCSKAVRPDPRDLSVPHVGAVCVYNDMVGIARQHLDSIGGLLSLLQQFQPHFPLAAHLELSRFKILVMLLHLEQVKSIW